MRLAKEVAAAIEGPALEVKPPVSLTILIECEILHQFL